MSKNLSKKTHMKEELKTAITKWGRKMNARFKERDEKVNAKPDRRKSKNN